MHMVHRILAPKGYLQENSLKDCIANALEPYGNSNAYDYYFIENIEPIDGEKEPEKFQKEILTIRDYQRDEMDKSYKALKELSGDMNELWEGFESFEGKTSSHGKYMAFYWLHRIAELQLGNFNFESGYFNCNDGSARLLYDDDVEDVLEHRNEYVLAFVNLHI